MNRTTVGYIIAFLFFLLALSLFFFSGHFWRAVSSFGQPATKTTDRNYAPIKSAYLDIDEQGYDCLVITPDFLDIRSSRERALDDADSIYMYIESASLKKDNHGDDCLEISYNVSNFTGTSISLSDWVYTSADQNNIRCENSNFSGGRFHVEDYVLWDDIEAGASVHITEAFMLYDIQSPVRIDVGN